MNLLKLSHLPLRTKGQMIKQNGIRMEEQNNTTMATLTVKDLPFHKMEP